ncbi:unnamed protein product [Durusdinium trenchii]|uniref:Uncharacterized protein n=2 Tax=Durusdinium trenchii TaxID=1381693 RepID=A0ABP0LQ65_9DINO
MRLAWLLVFAWRLHTYGQSCELSEHLDALELVEESEPLDLHSLRLLQVQQTLTQGNVSTAMAPRNSTGLTQQGSGSASRPLKNFTRFIHAPNMRWAILALGLAVWIMLGSLVLGLWYLCRQRQKDEPSMAFKVTCASFVVLAAMAASWLAMWYFAGALMKKWLMEYDVAFLGVDVAWISTSDARHIVAGRCGAGQDRCYRDATTILLGCHSVSVDRIVLNPWFGTLLATNLTIGNPPGYTSQHLAHVQRLFINVDMGSLVKSLAHRLSVDRIDLTGVDVVYQRSWSTLNLEELMKRLGAGEGGGAAAAPRGSHSWHLDLQVHQVNTSDVWVHADVYPMTSGVSLAVPNLAWKDFEEEVKPRSHDEAVVVVLATVLSNAKRVLGL